MKTISQKNPTILKQKIWDEKMNQMLQPDIYGYILDEKIRETVVALNLLGINTTQSDQGNYSDSPWIEFQASEPENYYLGEEELRIKILKERGLPLEVMDDKSLLFNRSIQVDIWSNSRDKLMSEGMEYTPEFLRYFEDTKNMVNKMQNLIDEYYSHAGDLENKGMKIKIFYIYDNPKYVTYIRHVPHLQVSVPEASKSEEERLHRVQQTQNKMLKFTAFLKNKFFGPEYREHIVALYRLKDLRVDADKYWSCFKKKALNVFSEKYSQLEHLYHEILEHYLMIKHLK